MTPRPERGLFLVIEGIDKVTEALGDAWTGFREGEQAAAQLGTTWKNLGLDGSRLQGTIDAISESTLKLGTDDTEAINAYNQALQNTGGKPTEAMKQTQQFLELLETENVLIVPGSSFNVPYRDHFRVTLLPQPEMMREVFVRIDRALARRAEAAGKVVPIKGKARNAAA